METEWGVEVKSGESLPVDPGDGYIVRISQISLENKKMDENELVDMYMEVDGEQKRFLGMLPHESVPHLTENIVLKKPFKLSHTWNNGSVFFSGYKFNANEPEGNDGPEPADRVDVGSDEESDKDSEYDSCDETIYEEKSRDEKDVPSDAPLLEKLSDIPLLEKWIEDFEFTKDDSPPPPWPHVDQDPDEKEDHDSFHSRVLVCVCELSPETTESDLETLFRHGAKCSKLIPRIEYAELRFPSLAHTKSGLDEAKGKKLHGKVVLAMRAFSNLRCFCITGFKTIPLDEDFLRAQLTKLFTQPGKGYEVEKISFPNTNIGLCYLHAWVKESMLPIMTKEEIRDSSEVKFKIMGETNLRIAKCELTFKANMRWLGEDKTDRLDIYGQPDDIY